MWLLPLPPTRPGPRHRGGSVWDRTGRYQWQRAAFVLHVRNTGEREIPNLVVTLRGFAGGGGEFGRGASRGDRWLVDEPPRGTLTVRVSAQPAQARVDPSTGAVVRRE